MTQPNSDIGRRSVELLVQALAGEHALDPDASLLLPHALSRRRIAARRSL